MIKIYFLKVDPLSLQKYPRLVSYISEEKRRKIDVYRNINDALQSVYGELLIRTVIIKKFNLKNEDILISKNEYGKPFVRNKQSFSFNISHSGEWVAIAVSNQSVGIDIEKIVLDVDAEAIIPYCSESERNYLYKKRSQDRGFYFYQLWTTKESFVKYIGQGLHYPLETVESLSGNRVKGMNDEIAFVNRFVWINNYQVSICTEEKKKLYVKKVDLQTINNIIVGKSNYVL